METLVRLKLVRLESVRVWHWRTLWSSLVWVRRHGKRIVFTALMLFVAVCDSFAVSAFGPRGEFNQTPRVIPVP